MTSSVPSPELENLSMIFIGFVATTVLYGLTFFQTYIYYTRYPKDSQWLRYLVTALCILDTTTSALVCEVLYYYLIILFDVNLDVFHASVTFCVQYMLSVLLTFISSLFFVLRVFQVTGGSKLVTVILVFLSFIALVFGLTASVQILTNRRLSAFGSLHMEVPAAISQASSMTVDIIMFGTMCYSLRRARYPEIVIPHGFLQNAATVLVGRGLAFSLAQVAYFLVFIAAPSRQLWIPFQMVASKLYVNTLLGQLNSRDVRHGQGIYEEDSLVDRKAPTNRRFPASIRLNVTDNKATTQSINFATTQHADTESVATELDSRKTYQDEHGNEYAQVSTGSSQSQTDEAVKTRLSDN